MKIVIVGSGGRLGAALQREWSREGDEILGFNHASLDLSDAGQIRRGFEGLEFDALVNCAALTNVDYCESHEAEAFRINAVAAGELAALCRERRARLIHISTDYVFDGDKREPYTEEDVARPLSVYAASKLAGEEALLEQYPAALAVRVSWVFGPDRPSFIDQILKRAQETSELSAVADKWAVPTYTLDAARLLRRFLAQTAPAGLLHLCNSGACSWQEYGQFAVDCAARRALPLRGRTVAPLKLSEMKAFIARRPVYTVMSTARLGLLLGEPPRSWKDAVEEYVDSFVCPSAPQRSLNPPAGT